MKLFDLLKGAIAALFVTVGASVFVAPQVNAQSFDRTVQADILPGWRAADGTIIAALRIRLNPGWKTYWRAPGDAGIPPTITWRGSRNLSGAQISWPVPHVFDQNGMRSIGYKDELILPLRLAPKTSGAPIKLRAQLDIGVCRDICVPQTLKVSAELPATLTKPVPAIAAALASVPYSSKEAGVKSATCRISPTSEGVRVTAKVTMPSSGGTEVVVIETANPEVWVAEAQSTRQGNTLTASAEMIHQDGDSFLIDRAGLRITVLGHSHAVDIQGCTAG
jgi:DsbC/DsbD-like thiol-disulfide interchange protein